MKTKITEVTVEEMEEEYPEPTLDETGTDIGETEMGAILSWGYFGTSQDTMKVLHVDIGVVPQWSDDEPPVKYWQVEIVYTITWI